MTLEEKDELTKRVIARIEGQNWTDHPMTEDERHLIGMAVDATVADLDA